MIRWVLGVFLLLWPMVAVAQNVQLDSKQPIEIEADTLEVFQNEQKAVFTGNVVAVQGNIRMKSATMRVFYKDNKSKSVAAAAGVAKGIAKIEAEGGVFFSSPTETARSHRALYLVDRQLIQMDGEVVLTREQNILKGTQFLYNLANGKSVLSSAQSSGDTQNGGRVKGVFIPNQAEKR